MPAVKPIYLQGEVPKLRLESIKEDARESIDRFLEQLRTWGFMAMEVPGIGASTDDLYTSFSAALKSTSPKLSDYSAEVTPQASGGTDHGFFRYQSETLRPANGVPDPKEFLHVSGAMLDDHPAGAAAMLQAFPELRKRSLYIFTTGFSVALVMGDLVRDLLPGDPPKLGLSAYSSVLRIIRYRDSGNRTVLAHQHSGIEMLGLQFPPSDGGLQYLLNDGTWVEPVLKGTDVLLCTIGGMLAMASGHRIRPSTHRVHRSPMNLGVEQWSAVVLTHPNHSDRQWRIDGEGDVERFDSTWGEFVNQDQRNLGLSP